MVYNMSQGDEKQATRAIIEQANADTPLSIPNDSHIAVITNYQLCIVGYSIDKLTQ